jgi:hypothetical protein
MRLIDRYSVPFLFLTFLAVPPQTPSPEPPAYVTAKQLTGTWEVHYCGVPDRMIFHSGGKWSWGAWWEGRWTLEDGVLTVRRTDNNLLPGLMQSWRCHLSITRDGVISGPVEILKCNVDRPGNTPGMLVMVRVGNVRKER